MPQEHGRNFSEKVSRIIDNILEHEQSSIEAAKKLLEQLRIEVNVEIAQGGSEFNLSVLRNLIRAIEFRIDSFERELKALLTNSMDAAGDLGKQMVNEAVIEIGGRPLVGISSQMAIVAAEYSLAYVSGLSIGAKDKIVQILRRAALGGLTPYQAIELVGKSLDSPGAFSSLWARAETIVRTETLRMASIATQARMLENRGEIAKTGYVLKKEWVSAHDKRVRVTHSLVDGQIREVDQDFDVPIGLVGLIAGDTEPLMYPRDPKGSIANTINCRCVSAPVVEKAEAIVQQSASSLLHLKSTTWQLVGLPDKEMRWMLRDSTQSRM